MTAENNKTKETVHHDAGYEAQEVDIKRIVLIGLAFIALLIISLLIIDQYFTITTEQRVEEVVLRPVSVALRELRSREDDVLNSYKVLDAQRRTYQIPIDRAMELVAQEAFARTKNSGEQ